MTQHGSRTTKSPARAARLVEYHTVHREAAGSIPGQHMPGLQVQSPVGASTEDIDVSLSLMSRPVNHQGSKGRALTQPGMMHRPLLVTATVPSASTASASFPPIRLCEEGGQQAGRLAGFISCPHISSRGAQGPVS